MKAVTVRFVERFDVQYIKGIVYSVVFVYLNYSHKKQQQRAFLMHCPISLAVGNTDYLFT